MSRPSLPLVLRLFAGIAVAATLAGGLTACSPEPAPCPTDPAGRGLALAVGARANSPLPTTTPEITAELDRIIAASEAEDAARPDTDTGPTAAGVTMVRVDGRPAVDCVVHFNTETNNTPARERAIADFTAAVPARMTGTTARAPESDLLEALALAASAAGPGGTVVLIDSGLQTVAPLDFREPGLLNAGVETVVTALDEAGMLPDLSDRNVILSGIGSTAAPQPELNGAQRAHLIELWHRIAEAGGAREVTTLTEPRSTPPRSGLPSVSVVDVPEAGVIDVGCDTESILSDDGPVGFRPDSTEFIDAAAARQELTAFAEWLGSNPTAHGHVTGSIAHYGLDSPGGLSATRAEEVRGLLLELGADPGQVSTEGAGWGPFPSRSAGPDPTSDPLNRRVVIELSCR